MTAVGDLRAAFTALAPGELMRVTYMALLALPPETVIYSHDRGRGEVLVGHALEADDEG